MEIFDELYYPSNDEKTTFGNKWCGPEKYPHGQEMLIAEYPKTSNDGQTVSIYCNAMPARFYILKVKSGFNSIAIPQKPFEVSTGSGREKLADSIAKAIAEGMLGFEPTSP